MNIKRILSSALVAVMLLTVLAPIIPVKSEAAYSSQITSETRSKEEIRAIVTDYTGETGSNEFGSTEEMFNYDKDKGYLVTTSNGQFSIHVNKYTGVMYYVNNATGEMLTSNSYNIYEYNGTQKPMQASQIMLEYSLVSDTENNIEMYSSTDAAKRGQISVTRISGGLRVTYAMGNTTVRELFPLAIEMNSLEEKILRPMMDSLEIKADELFGEDVIPNYFESEFYNKKKIEKSYDIHTTSVQDYQNYIIDVVADAKKGLYEGVDYYGNKEHKTKLLEIESIAKNAFTILNSYAPINLDSEYADMMETLYKDILPKVPIVKEGYKVYYSTVDKLSTLAGKAKIIKSLCPNYKFENMYEDEKFCGYVAERRTEPVFRMSLEYTFNDDGTLSVRLPSNSIVFDETQYILKSVTPLQNFGAADFRKSGYIFIPDGSGAIIDFDDFRDSNVAMALNTYGQDYCYSEITGSIYGQQVTVPVYGSVSQTVTSNGEITTGYFAIIEEGASMANLKVNYKKSAGDQGSVYSTFTPYPVDKFDLSDTISVGGARSYSMVAESKYTGSYITRYAMLSANADNKVGGSAGRNYYPSYMGMAEYYRNYLIANGVIKELESVNEELPLYIEALGSVEVIEKFLTFPINVSKAITTFDNVAEMYEELANSKEEAKAKLLAKAAEYQARANAENESNTLKAEYQKKADMYTELANKTINIDRINFKLTGFANGGMYFTYPSRVKWERSLGGKRDFKKLLEVADENTDSDSTFGIYPDFDFQYVNNTKLFDGVGKRNTISRMVDNRYASKQAYSNITGEFDTLYAMIVSADALDRLYDKFIKKYDNYDVSGISVSTLGSDLNSNFDKKNPISRDEAQTYVSNLLDRIANESDYSVMISKGNIYAVEYADHILDMCTDSSYYRYSSYAIPFLGMLFHGYVNYAGAAFNYSGSPDYDLLRSIESGASLYYILGYQNTDLMKDDEELNKYYSVSYENWYDNILENYAKLNDSIGDIQDYKIVDHKILIGERVIEDHEVEANLNTLKAEFIDQLDLAISKAIDAAYDDMQSNVNGAADEGRGIKLDVDVESLLTLAHAKLELDVNETLAGTEFETDIRNLIAEYKNEIRIDDVNGYLVTVNADSISYESAYKYVTGSIATDGNNYDETDYTVDNNLIVMVTYKNNEGKTRSFILNYNIYSVEVILEDGAEPYIIEKYGFVRIDG